MSDERRLKDEADVPRGLLAALEDGQRDLPSEDEVRALEASVLLALRAGGGGGAAKAAAKATSGVQVGMAGAILAIVAAVAVWSATRDPASIDARAGGDDASENDAPFDALDDAGVNDDAPSDVGPDVADDVPHDVGREGLDGGRVRARLDAGEASTEAVPVVPRTVEETVIGDEVALLRAAQAALRTDPAEALAITERMTRIPSPAWQEERERVAIEALDALHRDAEARARFDRFVARFPSSAYRARLEEIFARPR